MKSWTSLLLLTLVFIGVYLDSARSDHRDNKRVRARLRKSDITDLKFIAVNNWRYVMRNTGSYMYDSPDVDRDGNNAGGIFPRSEYTAIVFAGGFYFGTIKGTNKVVSEVEFATEYQPGRIVNSNLPWDSLKVEDPNAATQKVYVLDQNSSEQDGQEWPGERDQSDSPALIASAQTWAVFNDLDTSKTQESRVVSPDPGLGIEITLQSYAFGNSQLGDAVFMRMTIRNKTSTTYSQSYIGLWMDPDVINAGNDIVGVDTTRGLGFCYNANNTDRSLAVGFDFLQGPVANYSELPSKEITKFQSNNHILVYDPELGGFKKQSLPANQLSLGATSFSDYAGGTDPSDNEERYFFISGRFGNGAPKGGGPGYYDYYSYRGDPLAPNASSDPNVMNINNAADQRMLLSAGPFTLLADSSQDIWFAIVGAEGADRLDAVRNLFETDDFIQDFFNIGFSGLKPPDVPRLTVSPGDGQIILTWQNNAEYSEDGFGEALNITAANGYTADYVKHDFQGYRVYRSRTGLIGSFELLAEYDIDDTLGVITNRTVGPNGNLQIEDVELGQNTGLRYFYIDSTVTNGQTYYYSVTAYDAQPYIAGPGSMSLGENNTVIRAEATAALFADIESPKFVYGDSMVVLDSVSTVNGQFPYLGFITQIYRPDSDPTTILGDTLLVTAWVDTGSGPSIQVTHAYLCTSKQEHQAFYDHDEIRHKVQSPVVGQTFIDNRILSVGTRTAQRDYTWTIQDIITSGLSIPRPAGIPISLESPIAVNIGSAVPQQQPFDRGQTASVDSAVHAQGQGDGTVTISVVDPSQVREDTYTIRFVVIPTDSNGAPLVGVSLLPADRVVYEILNSTGIRPIQTRADDPRTFYDGNANGVFDGSDIPLDESRFGTVINPINALMTETILVDGLIITVTGPRPGVKFFQVVATGGGTLANPDMGAFAFNASGFPTIDGQAAGGPYTIVTADDGLNDRPNVPNLLTTVGSASVANGGKWGIHVGGGTTAFNNGSSTSFVARVFRSDNFNRFVPYDWEIRFTATGGLGAMAFTTGSFVSVPFELWRTGINTPNDVSDDYRCIPWIFDEDGDDAFGLTRIDHAISGGDNDPFTDWIYFRLPEDFSTSTSDYDAWAAGEMCAFTCVYPEVMARTVLVNWNGGSVSDAAWPSNVNQLMPANGTVFRIVSTKPLSASDAFTFSTRTVPQHISEKSLRKALQNIRVVPNPFYLTAYQQGSSFNKEIKFTHLPGACTIRIFTVAGDLVTIIQHHAASNNNRPGFSPYSGDTATPLETSLESWDLRNDRGKLIASGIYIAAIEAPGIGRQLVKFAVVR